LRWINDTILKWVITADDRRGFSARDKLTKHKTNIKLSLKPLFLKAEVSGGFYF
jgi:hypothetical protein